MDVQDHTLHTSPSGHEGHHGGLCHRCGWPYPNPHPSAKHRRAHKKICGTIEGYTNLIASEVVSDDEHHSDDDKQQTPSPTTDKKTNIDHDGGDVEIKRSFTRSEDEVFADAVTEFADSGSANKTLNKDLFFSFKDAENTGTNEVVNDPIEISKVDTSIEVSEKADPHVEKIEETAIKAVGDLSESNLELTKTDDLVKDGDVGPTREENSQESQTSETITEEAKDDSEITKTTPEVSANGGGNHDNVKQESFEKVESVITDGISEEIKQEIKSDCEHVSEAVKETEIVEETKIEKLESDQEIVPEVVKESEIEQTVSDLDIKLDLGAPNEQIQEAVNDPAAILIEKKNLEAEQIQESESVKEPVTDLIEKEDLAGSELENQSIEHTREVEKNPDSILTEKDSGAVEQIQEIVKEPETVVTEKEDLGGPHLEKQSNEHTHEAVKKSDLILTENVVEEHDSGAHKSEKCSEDEVEEQKVIADVSSETITLKDLSDDSIINSKNDSVVCESVVEEINGKLKNNEDSGADLNVDSNSVNSLEGTWGSVSVLSTASIDTETTEKSKVNPEKSNAAKSDDFEPPSFMTLVEPESKDNKSDSSEAKDSQLQPNSEASKAGWFPTLTKVNNESEGRKKNEEVMAKVANLGSGKQSTPLMNLLGDAKSPSGKQPEPVVQKDEATVNPLVNDDVASPPKLIEDGNKGKKGKGRSLWVPFMCCSSANAVK